MKDTRSYLISISFTARSADEAACRLLEYLWDKTIHRRRDAVSAAEGELARQLMIYGAKHPKVLQVAQALDAARAAPRFKVPRLVRLVEEEAAAGPSGHGIPGRAKSTWSYDREVKAWYFHRFYDFQPDLNTSHPEVVAEILKIMGFWIQLGVSGFRMDAVQFIIATKGSIRTRFLVHTAA